MVYDDLVSQISVVMNRLVPDLVDQIQIPKIENQHPLQENLVNP